MVVEANIYISNGKLNSSIAKCKGGSLFRELPFFFVPTFHTLQFLFLFMCSFKTIPLSK